MTDKAVFFDRDGTLNHDSSYINHPDDFDLYDFVYPALKQLIASDYKIIIVSNQSGVGRGYISEEQLNLITDKMNKLLMNHGISVDAVFYAYYYENSENPKYREKSHYRKPMPGMLLKAKKKFSLDLKKCYIIGDRISDIHAGLNAECRTILVRTGDGKKTEKILSENPEYIPDYICDNVLNAVRIITAES